MKKLTVFLMVLLSVCGVAWAYGVVYEDTNGLWNKCWRIQSTCLFSGKNETQIPDVSPEFSVGEDAYLDLHFKVEDLRTLGNKFFNGKRDADRIYGMIYCREDAHPIVIKNGGVITSFNNRLSPLVWEDFSYTKKSDGSITNDKVRLYFVVLNPDKGYSGSVRFLFSPESFSEKSNYKVYCDFFYYNSETGDFIYLDQSDYSCAFTVAPKEKISYKSFYGTYAITEQSKMNYGKEIMDFAEKNSKANGVDFYSGMSESEKKELREFDEWFESNRDMRMTFSSDGSVNLKLEIPVDYKEDFGFIYEYFDDDASYEYDEKTRRITFGENNGNSFRKEDYILFSADFSKALFYRNWFYQDKNGKEVLDRVFEYVLERVE